MAAVRVGFLFLVSLPDAMLEKFVEGLTGTGYVKNQAKKCTQNSGGESRKPKERTAAAVILTQII